MTLSRRRLLAALTAGVAPALVRHARAADTPRFALGIASGQPQSRTVVLWTMLTGADLPSPVDVAWELADDEAFQRIVARGNEVARVEDHHAVHAEPQGLTPERWYWYRFRALGQQSGAGRTRTAPQAVADRRVPGVVMLGGDVHANYVADLKVDFDDERSPVVASEFCGTSITSLGLDNARVAAARALNPHVHHARSDQRGYVRLQLTAQRLQGELMVLDDARDAASAIQVGGRYAVDAGRPGIQRG
jgi:phosphodiesterase/alkaline phosphatase D-like protein